MSPTNSEDNNNTINTNAFNFFNDININELDTSLNNLDSSFTILMADLSSVAHSQIKYYEPNNYTNILKTNDNALSENLSEIHGQTTTLKTLLETSQYDISFINSEIKNADNKKLLAELKLNELLSSDNAAIGLLKDTNYISNVIISENIILLSIIIIFIIFKFKFKRNN